MLKIENSCSRQTITGLPSCYCRERQMEREKFIHYTFLLEAEKP